MSAIYQVSWLLAKQITLDYLNSILTPDCIYMKKISWFDFLNFQLFTGWLFNNNDKPLDRLTGKQQNKICIFLMNFFAFCHV